MSITAEHIIRNVKLHLLSGIELKEPYKAIYSELIETFTNMKCYNLKARQMHFIMLKLKII